MHTRESSAIGKWNYGTFTNGDVNSIITMGNNVDPSSIYPTLKMGEKPKVIVEAQLTWKSSSDYAHVNGKRAGSAREVFEFFAATPKCHKNSIYFPSVVTFTPCGGFSATKITTGA